MNEILFLILGLKALVNDKTLAVVPGVVLVYNINKTLAVVPGVVLVYNINKTLAVVPGVALVIILFIHTYSRAQGI